jgi:flagellar hook-length control protein FliK
LQVKDKEVSAIFKTENQDVHRIMHEQVANLKQSLEQQGLKVNKIEIQSSNQNNNSFQHWLGEEGHNEAREQSQNFSEAGRRQRLRKAKQGAAEDETAQEMLINNNMDKVSSSSLYVVA